VVACDQVCCESSRSSGWTLSMKVSTDASRG
jgi:hypothetical protein